jgi:hypothetical protein
MSELDNNNINKMFDTNENENENDMPSVECELYNLKINTDLNLIQYDIADIELEYPRHITIYTHSFKPNFNLYYDSNNNLIDKWIKTDKDHIYYNLNDIYVNLEHKKLILINHYKLKKYKEEITDLGFIKLIEVGFDKFDAFSTY